MQIRSCVVRSMISAWAAVAGATVAFVACGEGGLTSVSSDATAPEEPPQLSDHVGLNQEYVERIRALAVACFRADGSPMTSTLADQWNRKAEDSALPKAIIAALRSSSDVDEFSSLLAALVGIGTSGAHEALFLYAMETFADSETDVRKVRVLCSHLGQCGVFGLAALTSVVGDRAIRRADEGWFIDPWHKLVVSEASTASEAHLSALVNLMQLAMDERATDAEKAAALVTLTVLGRRQPIAMRTFRLELSASIDIGGHSITLAEAMEETFLVQHMMQIKWHNERGPIFVTYRLNDAELETLRARYRVLLSELPPIPVWEF